VFRLYEDEESGDDFADEDFLQGAGVGQAMAGAMAGMMQPAAQPAAQPAQSVQPTSEDPQAKLAKLKSLLDGGLIAQEDYDKAKAEVLKQLIG